MDNFILVRNCSLKKYNTLRLESQASLMAFPLNENGVQEIYQIYKSRRIIVLGNGSNILLSKKIYNEDYMFISFKMMDNLELVDGNVFIQAGSKLSALSWFALENNVKDFEFLEDVPGSIGGAIVMNAGTYSDNIGQLVESLTYYDISKDKIVSEKVINGDFGRRTSKWSNKDFVILSCLMIGKPGNYMESLEKLLEIKKNRYLKQPRNYPNAGSVFKRPTLDGKDFYVWKLFNELNLRGYKKNDAMISEKHPGFIINLGNASYEDIKYLIDFAALKVKKQFNIDLELEWKII